MHKTYFRHLFSIIFLCISSLHAKEVVILLHGLGRHASSMKYIKKNLVSENLEIYSLDYESRLQNFNQNVSEIHSKIKALQFNEDRKISFIGHSLGGLVAMKILSELPAERRGLCITLGSPFYGSPVLEFLKKISSVNNFYGPIFNELAYFDADTVFEGDVHPVCLVGKECPVYLNFFGWMFINKERYHDCLVGASSASYNKAQSITMVKTHHNGLLFDEKSLAFIKDQLKVLEKKEAT
jgi:pimeloyl-ACP methyl ester carboxylesterase